MSDTRFDVFDFLTESDIADSVALSLFYNACRDTFGGVSAPYIRGLGRANSDYDLWDETHLYLPVRDSYLPMCDRGWNRDSGSSFSILRGNEGALGTCPVCIARAGLGLPPAVPNESDEASGSLKPGLTSIPHWARLIVHTQEWVQYDHSRSLSVGDFAEFWLERSVQLQQTESSNPFWLASGSYDACVVRSIGTTKTVLFLFSHHIYCELPTESLQVNCASVSNHINWRLDDLAVKHSLRQAIQPSQHEFVEFKRYYPHVISVAGLPTIQQVVEELAETLRSQKLAQPII